MTNSIEIRGLSKSYGDFALRDVSFTLPGGAIMGLIGENGAGKTTTIKCILNLIRRDGGEITLLGRDNLREERVAKEDVGVVLDECFFHDSLHPRDINAILAPVYRDWDSGLFRDYLDKFKLPQGKQVKDFSRGMKMKLSLAAALAHRPRLLILDEATAGLDPVVRDEVLDLFSEFTREENHAVLISSHIVSDLEKICDYIAFLHRGKLLLCEEKDALKEEYGILRCTAEQLSQLLPEAIIGRKETAYGVEAIAARNAVPAGLPLSPIDIEELFIFMVKEANQR